MKEEEKDWKMFEGTRNVFQSEKECEKMSINIRKKTRRMRKNERMWHKFEIR